MGVWPQEAQDVGFQTPVPKGMGIHKRHPKPRTERGNRAEQGVRRAREGRKASEDKGAGGMGLWKKIRYPSVYPQRFFCPSVILFKALVFWGKHGQNAGFLLVHGIDVGMGGHPHAQGGEAG